MQRSSRIRLTALGALAGLLLVGVIAGTGFAAEPLSRAEARDAARKHADSNKCPAPCKSVLVRHCDRVRANTPNKRICKAKTRSLLTDGERVCQGKVKVTKSGRKISTKSLRWRCKDD